MKPASIKVTYSLDPLTVLQVKELAVNWNMPQSEVIRRSIHAAHAQGDALAPFTLTPAEALATLQRQPRLSPANAKAWMRHVRAERRSARRA